MYKMSSLRQRGLEVSTYVLDQTSALRSATCCRCSRVIITALYIPLSLLGRVSWNICVCVCMPRIFFFLQKVHSTEHSGMEWTNGKCDEAHETEKTGQVELFLFAELFLFLSSQRLTTSTSPLLAFRTTSVCLDCSPSVGLIALQRSRKETRWKCPAYSVPDRIAAVLKVWFYNPLCAFDFSYNIYYNKSGNDDMTCLFKVAISVYYPCVR